MARKTEQRELQKSLCLYRVHCASRARKKKQLSCLKCVCVCVCVCVSKLSELAKDKTLKDAEKIKFLCKLFNVAEYVFTQHIVF